MKLQKGLHLDRHEYFVGTVEVVVAEPISTQLTETGRKRLAAHSIYLAKQIKKVRTEQQHEPRECGRTAGFVAVAAPRT